MNRFLEQFVRYVIFRSLYRMIYKVAGPFGIFAVVAAVIAMSFFHRDIASAINGLTGMGY